MLKRGGAILADSGEVTAYSEFGIPNSILATSYAGQWVKVNDTTICLFFTVHLMGDPYVDDSIILDIWNGFAGMTLLSNDIHVVRNGVCDFFVTGLE